MTRLASFCSGVLEVASAVAVRLEDVVGEWVDGLWPRSPIATGDRPKRSRVQEAADRKWPERKGTGWGADISAREETVRAVVDWLLNGCCHGEDSSNEYASVIAREFLEPR